jgi:DNA repair exonuclease SbcCD ATPase subunit
MEAASRKFMRRHAAVKWSMKTKLVGMGLGGLIGLAMLAVMSFMSYQAVHGAMEGGAHRIQQMGTALDVKAAQLKLVLTAMQSIVERNSGKISEENTAGMREASSVLMKHMEQLGRHSGARKDDSSFAEISEKVEKLNQTITKDLIELIAASDKKLAEIEKEFSRIHDALVDYSSKVDSSINTFEAAIQLKITLAATEDEAGKLKEANESLIYIRKTVNSLVIAALESIIEKETGQVAEKRMSIITRDSGYLEKNVPKLADYAQSDDEKAMAKKIQSDAEALSRTIKSELAPLIKDGASEASKIRDAFHKFESDLNRNAADVAAILDRAADLSRVEAEKSMSAMKNTARSTFDRNMVVFFASVLIIIPTTLFLAGKITGILKRMSERMNESAAHIASASEHLAAAGQQLSEGASEQAASIEETSSSLEEMASMTRQNADNASQANQLMAETDQVVSEASVSMTQLTASMGEISKASEETSKIVKTIDEIAFQTNLLALNAAVEAARAGEAGAGFAVVADEVRNLAMRAADAARNTANLIEGTVTKIKEGSKAVQKTGSDISRVATGARRMRELVGEITAASQEQAQGIDQINRAVSEMDKVVQRNSANAEESASASTQMKSQAELMNGFIHEMVALVEGSGNERKRSLSDDGQSESVPEILEISRSRGPVIQFGNDKGRTNRTALTAAPAKGVREKNPVELILLEDKEPKNS